MLGRLSGGVSGRTGVLAVAAAMAGSGAGCACAEALVWPFIGRHVHEVSGVLPRRTGEGNHGAMRDGRGAQGLPAGGAAGDPAGSTGERGMGRDASRGGSTRGTRGNAIMGLGRAADRSGEDVEDWAVVRQAPRGRPDGARARSGA